MKYKVICSDLDGTLLNSNSELSQENSLAIEKIVEKGYLFVPTTGRTLAELPPEVRNHKSIRYFIYSNGAGIYDRLEDKYYETLVEGDTMNKMLSVLEDYDFLYLLHRGGSVRLDKDAYSKVEEYRVWPAYLKLFKFIPDELIVENFIDYLYSIANMEMLVVFFKKSEDVEAECRARLAEIPELHVTSSATGNIEIVNKKANKGNAIRLFSEIVGIPTEDFITAGDSSNDIEMLRGSGLSLAVSGAKDIVKSAADKVICSNDEHIAKYILENII